MVLVSNVSGCSRIVKKSRCHRDRLEILQEVMRPEDHPLGFLGINLGENFEISEVIGITNKDFYNLRQRDITKSAQLGPDCWLSLRKYSEMICQEGGISLLEEINEEQYGGKDTFLFAFSTCWQVEVFLKYNQIVFLDSTHNTCISLEDRNRKAFLYTIVFKHDVTGCGIPLAFMVTNSETQRPLARCLAWLKHTQHLPTSIIFMIDCSATEMVAIETVFGYSQIRICHWHMLKAMRTQVCKKISIPISDVSTSTNDSRIETYKQIRKSAIDNFLQMIHSRSVAEFGKIWDIYVARYCQHSKQ